MIALIFLSTGKLNLLLIWKNYIKNYEKYFKIYIHSINTFSTDISEIDFEIIPNPIQARRFSYTMGQAMVHSLKYAYNNCDNITHFIFLSESCIPIQSPKKLLEILNNAGEMSLFSPNYTFCNDITTSDSCIFSDKSYTNGLQCKLDVNAKPQKIFDENNTILPLYTSQWQIISRIDALLVINKYNHFLEKHKKNIINRNWLCDSEIITSIILGSKRSSLFYPVSAQVWKPGHSGNRPYTFNSLTQNDLCKLSAIEFVEKAYKNGFLFARKFGNITTAIYVINNLNYKE